MGGWSGLLSLLLVLLVAATAVVKGADWFVESAVWVAGRTGVSEMTVGATIVALATTLPETVVSAYATYTGHPGLAVGNAVGSCLANGGLILGMAAAVGGFATAGAGFCGRCISLAAITGVVIWMTGDGIIGRTEAALLLGLVVAIMWSTWRRAVRTGPAGSREHGRSREPGRGHAHDHAAAAVAGGGAESPGSPSPALKFLFGAALIAVGSRFMVSSGTELAFRLGLSEAVVGLTLVSIGTSLPELATTAAAALRRHHDLALGNLLGANMLNLSLVLGLCAMIKPLPIDRTAASFHLPLVAAMTLLLLLFALVRRGIGRPEGLTLLVLYAAYVGAMLRR